MSQSDLGGLQNLFGNFIGPLIDLIFWNDPHPQAMKDRFCILEYIGESPSPVRTNAARSSPPYRLCMSSKANAVAMTSFS